MSQPGTIGFDAKINLSINSSETRSGISSAISSLDQISLLKLLTSFSAGSGTGQINYQFCDNRTGSTTYTNDTPTGVGITNFIDGLQGVFKMSKLTLILLINNFNADLILSGSVWTDIVGTTTVITINTLKAGGSLLLINPAGYSVTNGSGKTLALTTSGTTGSFDIVVMGS